MPTRRKRPPRSRRAALIRAARAALDYDQTQLADLAYVSVRTVCGWEIDELAPTPAQAEWLVRAVARASPSLVADLRVELGLAAPAPPVSPEAGRAALDAVVHAACEQHDVPPRPLREFAAALLAEIDRLSLTARDAAPLIAPKKPAT